MLSNEDFVQFLNSMRSTEQDYDISQRHSSVMEQLNLVSDIFGLLLLVLGSMKHDRFPFPSNCGQGLI